jgi:osmoprotectant transport system ATP-binding protein
MIEIRNVGKSFNGVPVLQGINLEVPTGSLTAIVGTSGSGKTTLLRTINRMIDATEGTIRIDGVDNRTLVGHELRRRIGYVIQNHGLFPHRTVFQNIATVPGLLGWARQRISERVDELLDLFSLAPARYRSRYPSELSGGEQQRVGVARALAAEPKLLLMDEPFGALDPIIRAKAQDDLMAVRARLGTTVVMVTHDMSEALRLADRLVVMGEGRILRAGSPADILSDPGSAFVAAMVGADERSFRLLSLRQVGDALEPGTAQGEPLDANMDARAALGALLWSGRPVAPVTVEGRIVGIVRSERLAALARNPNA